jgi:flagellar hook assembly protein FlgD
VGTKVKLRAVSGHRDTGSTSCPGNYLYAQLNRIAYVAEQTGLPKLYAPLVSGKIGGPVVFSGRLSSALPWNITVSGPGGQRVASASGTGPRIAWTWNSAGFAPGRYAWTMSAGSTVLAARGVVGGTALPPPAPLVSGFAVAPTVISPNGDGYADTGTVSYTLSARAAVTATVTDATGTAVETLFSGQEQSARPISFSFSPGDLPDGDYTLALAVQADDGRSETHNVAFTIDRILSTVTATPASVAPGAALVAGFALAGDAQVTVTIVAPDGSTAATLFQGQLAAGTYSYTWNGLLADGTPAPAGNYQVLVSVVDSLGTVTQPAPFVVAPAPP